MPVRPSKPIRRSLRGIEPLEQRRCLTLPHGAMPADTGEFMIGDVHVSVVLFESNGTIDANTENWTSAAINTVKSRIAAAATWWEQTFDLQGSVHDLEITVDYTYADNPVATGYEPISHPSYDIVDPINDFLALVGYNVTGDVSSDIRAFNHAQRLAHGADWAFTIFVVNNDNDPDGYFAPGEFYQAFSYPGGRFVVTLADRPASTAAHEIGHMFWAMDEYAGSSYTARRGYYNTQNWNADDNPAPGAGAASIMLSPDEAYPNRQISTSAKEMLGWKDSDGDGVFDVLDVPLSLSGLGYFDAQAGGYRFLGRAQVETLPNLNSSGLQNDITLNQVSRLEYRIDGGAWVAAQQVNAHAADVELLIPLDGGFHELEIRAIGPISGITSASFHGDTSQPSQTWAPGVGGFVWHDRNADGLWDASEKLLPGWTVRLVDGAGVPLDLENGVEPDDYAQGTALNTVNPAVTLSAIGDGIGADSSVTARDRPFTSTGTKVFHHLIPSVGWSSAWTAASRMLRMDFTSPVSTLHLDAVANSPQDFGRLDVYSASGQLLDRYTTAELTSGQVETMTVRRPTADIAYAIARGHANSAIQFDNLRFGPQTEAITDEHGAWSLPSLGGGEFHVEILSHPDWSITPGEVRTVMLSAGQAAGNIDFGVSIDPGAAPLHNADLPEDVTGDGNVVNADALDVIGFLRSTGGGQPVAQLPHREGIAWPFFDASGDNFISNLDAMLVVAEVRRRGAGAKAAAGAAGDAGWSGTAAGGSEDGVGASDTSDQGDYPASPAGEGEPPPSASTLAAPAAEAAELFLFPCLEEKLPAARVAGGQQFHRLQLAATEQLFAGWSEPGASVADEEFLELLPALCACWPH